jgi:hypothetical protein
MAIETSSKKSPSRRVQTGHGVTGIELNLPLVHMFFLCELRDRTKHQILECRENKSSQELTHLLERQLDVLEFICQDFTHPSDPGLWKIEEPKRIESMEALKPIPNGTNH